MLLAIMIFLFQLLIMWPLTSFTNQVELKVKVVDEVGKPVSNAIVSIDSAQMLFAAWVDMKGDPAIQTSIYRNTKTDSNGDAILRFNCRFGHFYFFVQAIGCNTHRSWIELKHRRRWDLTTKLLERKKEMTIVLKKKDAVETDK